MINIPITINQVVRIDVDGTQEAITVGGPGQSVDVSTQIPFAPLRTIERITAGLTFTQSVPALVWTVNHGLGILPFVQVRDINGNVIIAAITHIDANTCEIEHNTATAGTARIF